MDVSGIPTELLSAFETQRAAFAAQPWADWPLRADRLARLRRLIEDNDAAIIAAIDADFGQRPAAETEVAEMFPCIDEIKTALRHGKRWMRRRRVGVSKWFLPARGHLVPQPLGVVGVIVPWNYPLFLAIGPVVGALAAGNRVMIKMSEFSPRFSELFASLVGKHFAADEITVITGGPEVATAFSALPFDHLLFTGSTNVGRKVMAAAAEHLTPVTLELGGKSPTVLTPGYPLAHAAQRTMYGKLINAGQTCIAPDYALVPRAELEAFVAAVRAEARRMYPSGLADSNFCSVVNPRQYARLAGYLDEARAAGARVEPLFDGPARDDAAHRLAAHVLVDPPDSLRVMRDEIFGPLLPVVPYDTVEQALAYVKARPRPLALYWFDHDDSRVERMLHDTHAGGVCVNEVLMHVVQHTMPFGGVGPSGLGHYHGQWGFDTFSKLKPVFRQSRVNALGMFGPPYRPLMKTMLGLMKRF